MSKSVVTLDQLPSAVGANARAASIPPDGPAWWRQSVKGRKWIHMEADRV